MWKSGWLGEKIATIIWQISEAFNNFSIVAMNIVAMNKQTFTQIIK